MNQETFEDLDILETVKAIPAHSFPASFPMHWHTQVEILFVSLGSDETASATVIVNQTTYTLHRGDILFIWPGELHEITQNSDGYISGIQFSPSLIKNRPEFTGKYNVFCQEHLLCFLENQVVCTDFLSIFKMVVESSESSETYRGIEMLIDIYKFLIAFAQYTDMLTKDFSVSSRKLHRDTVQKIHSACAYISKNCTESLSLDDVALLSGFSSCYFSRIFKLVTDFSFTEYVSVQRIRYAQQLLSDTSLSITEIAFLSGFKSIPTFNRAFKQFEGYSPSEFKELYSK